MSVEVEVIGTLDGLLFGRLAEVMHLEHARKTVKGLGDGWRLPTIPELTARYDYDKWGGKMFDLLQRFEVQRFWAAHDAVVNTDEPYGVQFNIWGGSVWPIPADSLMNVVVVKERKA